MEIKIIEAYDSELGYDEDKYYEINSYKNMVVYAQKNKHKQGLEGITLDIDSLIEDLKKKRILIKSEFENIKESNLDKHYEYFILPDDFVDDIIIQLGFEPSQKRTYKNDEVEYLDEIISDIEFEQIITDEKNEFHWLSKCKFKDAKIKINEGWSGDNWISFLSGTWINGTWENGDFEDSIWKYGIWKNGTFENSTWKYGIWEDGTFENSTWQNGIWKDGTFNKSTWEKGVWENGEFDNSTWIDGNWAKGDFTNSTWKKGIWDDGGFYSSIWEDGLWKDGEFVGSTWEKGIWDRGGFFNSTWLNGTWKGGRFVKSIWKDGIWEYGRFLQSIWEKGIWDDGDWYISNKTKVKNIKNFNPKKIVYSLLGDDKGFDNIPYDLLWESDSLLLKILDAFKKYKDSVDIYIGNHKLTKQDIITRVKYLI